MTLSVANILLGAFEKARTVRKESQAFPNTDLQDLGLVLLNVMNSEAGTHLDANYVREQRLQNRLYGINDGERWSHCRSLIDFIDEMFTEEKAPVSKLEKMVRPF